MHRGTAKRTLRWLHTANYTTLSRSSIAVALTSRLVHPEAIKSYYSLNLNTFRHTAGWWYDTSWPENPVSHHMYTLRQFFNTIGPMNASTPALFIDYSLQRSLYSRLLLSLQSFVRENHEY